jgi:hypothetical protein
MITSAGTLVVGADGALGDVLVVAKTVMLLPGERVGKMLPVGMMPENEVLVELLPLELPELLVLVELLVLPEPLVLAEVLLPEPLLVEPLVLPEWLALVEVLLLVLPEALVLPE